jgi:hypothetical protein
MILGSDTITLPGSTEIPVSPPKVWLLPGHATPVITGTKNDGLDALSARNRRNRALGIAAAACLVCTAFLLGITVNDGQIAGAPTRHAAAAWKIESLLDDGLVMDIDGRQVVFRIGDTLPSGDVLLDTDVDSNRYRTDHSVVTLHGVPARAAAASTPPSTPASR